MKYSASEVAGMLQGREYGKELTFEESRKCKEAGIVVVFGASDDLMEFRGAIDDELGAYEGRTAHLLDGALMDKENQCDDCACPYFEKLLDKCETITAKWCDNGPYSWVIDTDIPHLVFDIVEDGEKFCRGIVFDISDLK